MFWEWQLLARERLHQRVFGTAITASAPRMRQIATGAGRRRGAALAVAGSAGRNGAPMVDALPRRQRPESGCHRPVRKCRRLLAGELGVEPGTTTRAC